MTFFRPFPIVPRLAIPKSPLRSNTRTTVSGLIHTSNFPSYRLCTACWLTTLRNPLVFALTNNLIWRNEEDFIGRWCCTNDGRILNLICPDSRVKILLHQWSIFMYYSIYYSTCPIVGWFVLEVYTIVYCLSILEIL